MNMNASRGYQQRQQQQVYPELQSWNSSHGVAPLATYPYPSHGPPVVAHYPPDFGASAIARAKDKADADAIFHHTNTASSFANSTLVNARRQNRVSEPDELARVGASLRRARSIVNAADAEGRLQAFEAFRKAKEVLKKAEIEFSNEKMDRKVRDYLKHIEQEDQRAREKEKEVEEERRKKEEKKALKKAKSFKDINLSRQLSKQFGSLLRRKSTSDSKGK